jgi:hypothetical protein
VYAVGHDGTLLHSSGGAWALTTLPGRPVLPPLIATPPDLFGIGGFTTTVGVVTTTDVYVVGEDGNIQHNSGSGWNLETVADPHAKPEQHCFYAVWGRATADVFAVGEGGMIYHFDGSTWKKQASGTGIFIYGVWGSSATNAYAVGSSGQVLHYSP